MQSQIPPLSEARGLNLKKPEGSGEKSYWKMGSEARNEGWLTDLKICSLQMSSSLKHLRGSVLPGCIPNLFDDVAGFLMMMSSVQ